MRTWTVALLALCLPAAARAAPRRLGLDEAVALALRIDPVTAEADVQRERARLGVLRAELDRMSFKVDGSVQEYWNKVRIGQPALYDCSLGGATARVSRDACLQAGGMLGAVAPDSQWYGQSSLTASLNYYLFSGFRVEANVKRARLQEQAAVVQIRQQQKEIAIAVARAYFAIRRFSLMTEVQRRSLERMADAEAVAGARVKAGLAPPIDVNRATQRRLSQLATLAEYEGQARTALAQLGVYLGLKEEFEISDGPPLPEEAPGSAEALVEAALGRRPEVAAARLQLAAQHQQVRIARSGFFPQLTLFGQFQYSNNPFDVATGARVQQSAAANPFANMGGSLFGGVALNMNFLDTLNTYTATGDARYQEKVFAKEVQRFERQVSGEVKSAFENLRRLYARRLPLNQAREVAGDNLKIVEARYKNGDALIIEYLDAQIDLANSELNLADLTAQMQLQWLELQAALGLVAGEHHG